MHGPDFFFQAFVYLTAAVVSVPIAKRLGLGSVLGYLLAGMAIGPFALGLIGAEGDDVLHFAEFGVVMMLFLVGLELRPALLWRLRGALLGLGGAQILLTTIALAGVAIAAGLAAPPAALAVGLILSLSSTAIVLQSLRERGLQHTDAGERSFAVLLFQDLAVIPMLALLPLLAASGGTAVAVAEPSAGDWLESLPTWARSLTTLGAVGFIVVAGQVLARPILRFIAASGVRETFTAVALLLVVGIALLMTRVGLSPALGTFVGGVVLAGSEYRHELESDIEPFKALLLGLFFLAVGASIDFGLVAARAGMVLALVIGLLVVKFLVLLALARFARMSVDQGLLFALALSQGGEFCFVLLSFAAQNGILDRESVNLLVATVALSMAATPLLLVAHERWIAPRLARPIARDQREPDAIAGESPVIIAGFGAFGSIVGRFLVANGVPTTVLDVDSDHVDLLRRLGLEVYYGDASREDLLRAAGAERAQVLLILTGNPEKTLAIVATARKQFPNLTIFARAHVRTEGYDLLDAGIERVYRESVDTSLRMGVDVLRHLGHHAHVAHRAAQSFRRHDERHFRELAGVRGQESAFLNKSRESIQLLERLLQTEIRGADLPRDGAWDTASMRAEYGDPPLEPGDRADDDTGDGAGGAPGAR